MKLIRIIATIIFLLAALYPASAQDNPEDRMQMRMAKNPEGTDFWLCFMRNFKDPGEDKQIRKNELTLELFITGDEDSRVVISIDNLGYDTTFVVKGGTVQSIKIDPLAQVTSSEFLEKGAAVHIQANKAISVYGLNRRFQTTDTYMGLPTRVLGKKYRAMCYTVSDGLMAQFAVVATRSRTEVTITPSVNTQVYPSSTENALKHRAGEPFTVHLQKGDVYQVAARFEQSGPCDLTGTVIEANHKIAVFSGHQCAYVPPRIIACNHLVEQMPPLPSWGKHFYLGMLQPRSKYTYRVLANEDSTKVFEDARFVKMLDAGDYFERQPYRNVQVTADKPVLVAQYSQGFKNGDSIGDPMMLLISPTQQFLRKYRFATPVNGRWKHYINVVTPTKGIRTMRLNNRLLDSNMFSPLGLSRYSIAYLQVPFGTHVIEGTMPFGMYSYGFGYDSDAFDAYGNMGGQSFLEYEPVRDTLPPTAEARYENNQMKIIFRDDRVDDTGIKTFDVLSVNNIEPFFPPIEEGAPQLSMTLRPKQATTIGRMTVSVTDVSLNTSEFTICYSLDFKEGQYIFSLVEGTEANCKSDPGFQVGAFGKFSTVIHNAGFSSSGDVHANGDFTDAVGTGGYMGIYFGRRIKDKLQLSGRLSLENYGGTIEAPDSSISHIRDTISGELIPYQESRLLTLDALFIHLGATAEWYFKDYFYLLGGLNFSFPVSDGITYEKQINIPEGYAFASGKRREELQTDNLSSLSGFRVGMFAGLGFTYPVYKRFSAFAEANYNLHFGNVINDGDWGLHQLSMIIGIRYQL